MQRELTRLGGLLIAIFLVGCDMRSYSMYGTSDKSLTYATNGEQIYFTGRNKEGQQIVFQGGNMHARMHVVACVDCHGEQREGGRRMYPSFWLIAPSLRREDLFGEHHDDHDEHMAYTRLSLKKAITYGVTPSGEELNTTMPRWLMNEADLDDLVDYLAGEHLK